MYLDIVYLPSELTSIDLSSRVAVVFDVLRATTTMITALANGAAEIRAFGTIDQAVAAHRAFDGAKLLAGERACLPPPGFDLGNSPGDFTADRVAGRTLFIATTNGTRAVRACGAARQTFIASLCNASAMAYRLAELQQDVVLVCAGVDGLPGGEDVDGAATVADLLVHRVHGIRVSERLRGDIARSSMRTLDADARQRRLTASPGGLNLTKASLARDIAFCAAVDRFELIGEVTKKASPQYASICAT